jgi:hypothetical protein
VNNSTKFSISFNYAENLSLPNNVDNYRLSDRYKEIDIQSSLSVFNQYSINF